jgi:hypothetical protein
VAATARNLTLPPLNTYFISVRAVDDVGNYSDYVAPTPLANLSTVDALVNPTAVISQGFGASLAIAKLNGDTIDDLAVGAAAANRVYLYFGRTGFGPLTACAAPTCQILVLPGTSSGDNFGTSVAVGNVGDAAPGLVVGSHTFSTNLGRAFLFFGGASPIDAAGFVEFRGATASAQFGRAVHVIGDIDGDGFGEVVIAAPNENAGRGRVYIFKGRTKANWLLARTGNDAGTLFVPASAANWTIEGPTPVASTSNFFGRLTNGFADLGDINGDGRADFSIPSSRETLNRAYLFSGAAVASATAPITTGDGATADQSLQRLVDSMFGTLGNFTGFGAAASGGTDLLNTTAFDLTVGYPLQNRVSIFADGLSTGAPYPGAPSVSLSGRPGTLFGTSIGNGDLNGDGRRDLVVGEGLGANSSMHFFYARLGSFDTTAGAFWQSRLLGSALGASVAVGDLNADAKLDVAMGDENVGSGQVNVWH